MEDGSAGNRARNRKPARAREEKTPGSTNRKGVQRKGDRLEILVCSCAPRSPPCPPAAESARYSLFERAPVGVAALGARRVPTDREL